ncbi:hypothetical protein IF1G_08151 [Cordyceps javanica]|uniref:Uncharacterized protein n=1 Tax=Cordyceps javanica TaxID=43265 RepID=A0A545UVT6_9HYPO|nr:hypothetical protein IF1G_08151 [Cordyceps javanica]
MNRVHARPRYTVNAPFRYAFIRNNFFDPSCRGCRLQPPTDTPLRRSLSTKCQSRPNKRMFQSSPSPSSMYVLLFVKDAESSPFFLLCAKNFEAY